MFYLGGVGLAFFLTLLLFSKRNKTQADGILAAWLSVITVHLLLFYLRNENLYPYTLGLEIPLPLLHGPFLYWYTRSLTSSELSFRWVIVHFIPAIVTSLYITPFLVLPLDQKVNIYQNKGVGYEMFNVLKTIAIFISGILYVVLASVVLHRHKKAIADQFSNTDKINLNWLQYLIYWIGVIWLLVIFTDDQWVFVGVVLFVGFIGFFGIRQVGIFHSQQVLSNGVSVDSDLEETVLERKKYMKSGLSAEASESLHQALKTLMQEEKIFREGELSLADLAQKMQTQTNYLSQVINEREGKNFYDYINSLRIEEFKQLASLPDSRKFTLVALAQQCGFNSKSSFNRYFKKITGQSPSDFMEAVASSQK